MSNKRARDLLQLCEKFVKENEIGCSETIYQCDRVIENAYEFIESVCEIVGFHQEEE